MTNLTEDAQMAGHLMQLEAKRLQHQYIGPEHLLLGLLRQPETVATRLLHAHGLDLETARAAAERLIAEGVLRGPRPSDAEVLATVGVDLEAVRRRLKETFGSSASYYAAQRVRLQARSAAPWAGMVAGVSIPTLWDRTIIFARQEADARGQEIGPEHLLLGLLRDASDPAGTGLYLNQRRLHAYLGVPVRGPHPVRLLIEGCGVALEALLAAVRVELDRSGVRRGGRG
jgi:ATP-dependent Clp protease ATP-binding subunit ClpA